MPDITYPTLSVCTDYENASPEEIEELVTRPIEEAMSCRAGRGGGHLHLLRGHQRACG